MKKTTNRVQFARLVEEMKKNPDIARNMTKRSPETLRDFWIFLKHELDSLGPPIKDVSEWKKVWSDFKSAIRKKLAAQNNEIRNTGGGPNKCIILTRLEEDVAELVNLRNCVSGLTNTISFELPNIEQISSEEANNQVIIDLLDTEENIFENNKEDTDRSNLQHFSDNDEAYETLGSKKRKRKQQENTNDTVRSKNIKLLENQISLQEKFYENLITALNSSNSTNKELSNNLQRIHKTLDKICYEKESQTKINQARLDESIRHNKEMESLLRQKIKLKHDENRARKDT